MGMKGFDHIDLSGAVVRRIRLPDDGPADHVRGVPGRHEFVVSGWKPPTLNQLMRDHIATRIRLGKQAREAIRHAFLESRVPLAWLPRRVSLEITLSGRQRECDVDSPWKATLDGLKHAGAIVDDSAKWCQIGNLSFLRGPETSTLIILEDL